MTATVGYIHPFVSLEDATFPGNLLFLERPSIINIERSVAAGIQRASLGANAATEDYFASAYLTGPLFGAQRPTLLNGEQVGLIGRLATRPYHDEDWNFHAEFSGQMAFHPNVIANGTPGVSRTTLTLADVPELRIDFNPLVSTGPLSARSANVYGGALGASWRNFLLAGEYYQISLNQSKLPGVPSPRLGFNGGYVDAGWVMTGEPIPYDITRAAWARPKVDHPFSLEDGGIGAWELAARYSTVDLNSNVVPGVPQSVTGGIYGGRQQIASSRAQLVPERLAAVHAAVPTRGRKQAEFGGHSPNRSALRDTRGQGAGHLVKLLCHWFREHFRLSSPRSTGGLSTTPSPGLTSSLTWTSVPRPRISVILQRCAMSWLSTSRWSSTPLVNPPLFGVLTWLERRCPASAQTRRARSGRNCSVGCGTGGGCTGLPMSGCRARCGWFAIPRAWPSPSTRGTIVPFRPSGATGQRACRS